MLNNNQSLTTQPLPLLSLRQGTIPDQAIFKVVHDLEIEDEAEEGLTTEVEDLFLFLTNPKDTLLRPDPAAKYAIDLGTLLLIAIIGWIIPIRVGILHPN